MLCDAINWHFGTLRIHFVVLNMEHIDKNVKKPIDRQENLLFLLNFNTWLPSPAQPPQIWFFGEKMK